MTWTVVPTLATPEIEKEIKLVAPKWFAPSVWRGLLAVAAPFDGVVLDAVQVTRLRAVINRLNDGATLTFDERHTLVSRIENILT